MRWRRKSGRAKSADLAARINTLMADPALRARMAAAGRRRVEQHFGWPAIAKRTADLYHTLVKPRG